MTPVSVVADLLSRQDLTAVEAASIVVPLMVVAFGAIFTLVLVVLIGAPLVGWPAVVRLPAVLVPASLLAIAAARPWRWHDTGVEAADRWQPCARVVWAAAIAGGLILFWIVLTRFQSGEINAVDFTVYFDRPCAQTIDGRLLFVETSDDARFSNRSELTDHAYWAMLPLCSLYAVYPTPYWLLAISVLAVVVGAVHAGRVVQYLGGGGLLSTATTLAFALNDNTARTLNYGFHPEVLFACFIPWMIDAGLRGRRRSYMVAVIACVLVKESACLSIFAAMTALALIRFRSMTWTDRLLFLALPNVIALANLGLYYGWVVPLLTQDGRPTYAYFWENYGPTPIQALLAMTRQPLEVLSRTDGYVGILHARDRSASLSAVSRMAVDGWHGAARCHLRCRGGGTSAGVRHLLRHSARAVPGDRGVGGRADGGAPGRGAAGARAAGGGHGDLPRRAPRRQRRSRLQPASMEATDCRGA